MSQILVLTAFDHEYQAIKKKLDPSVALFSTGMGMAKARQSAEKLIQRNYSAVLMVGYCGGLSAKVKMGELAICQRILCAGDKEGLQTHWPLAALKQALPPVGVSFFEGSIYTSPMVVESPPSKQALYRVSGADVVDMEAYEVAKAAKALQLPTLIAKVVIDDAATTAPKAVRIGEGISATPLELGFLENLNLGAKVLEASILPILTYMANNRAAFRWG